MPDRLGRSQPDADTDVITRAAAVPALAALAVIHVDLPGMPGPRPAGRVQVPRDRRGRDCGRRGDGSRASPAGPGGRQRARRAAMAGYVLLRALPGGFLGDHGDVGNWRCPLGIAALSALVQAASPRVR
jgi:hypothetical protein